MKNPFQMKKKEVEAMLESAISELHFEKLQEESLLCVLNEIEILATDPIIKKIVELGKERYNLDKIIHSKKLIQ
jgi:hypothetical protein